MIPPPYRWRDWASDPDKGQTGQAFLDFINNDLLPSLRSLAGSDEKLTIAALFAETYNRMLSGYLLRDMANLVEGIPFESKDEIFTLSHLYESMLKEMRDAAGDSGEFYTPRPVVKLIVDRAAPKLGERVMDPACGTGGFLVEAYEWEGAVGLASEYEDGMYGSVRFPTFRVDERICYPPFLLNCVGRGLAV